MLFSLALAPLRETPSDNHDEIINVRFRMYIIGLWLCVVSYNLHPIIDFMVLIGAYGLSRFCFVHRSFHTFNSLEMDIRRFLAFCCDFAVYRNDRVLQKECSPDKNLLLVYDRAGDYSSHYDRIQS